MIISLDEAQTLDQTMTQGDILAMEAVIRAQTNNHFHRRGYEPLLTKLSDGKLYFESPVNLFSVGATVEVYGTDYLDGFYTVKEVGSNYIEVDTIMMGDQVLVGANLFLIEYPADVVAGVRKVIQYKAKMASKAGIKSETVSRVSVTYYDVNKSEGVIDGVPGYLYGFLEPYKRLRWT